jgi:branched-chain amino acid transport system permease protein
MGIGLASLLLVAFIPLLPPLQTLAWSGAATLAVLYAFGVLSVVILTGYVGQISLCQATFMGVSAFFTAALINHYQLNYFVAAAGGVSASFLLGVIVGIPALRLRGILLAVVTAGVALSFDGYFYIDKAFGWFNGGVGGWSVPGARIFNVDLNNLDAAGITHIYWFLLAVFAVVAVLVVNLHDSGSGRRLRAIRESEVAAATMGVDLTRYKLLAFGLSAAVAGIGGAFFPLLSGSVTFQPFYFFTSLQFAAVAVLVGIRFVPAAVVGGVFIAVFPELLKQAQDWIHVEIKGEWFSIALGVLLIVQMITLPDGIWGQWAEQASHLVHRLSGRSTHAEPVVAK